MFAVWGMAFRHGRRLGVHCCFCCTNLTPVLLMLGVMDLCAMAIVTAAIGGERLAPSGVRVAPAIGIEGIGAGVLLVTKAIGLG